MAKRVSRLAIVISGNVTGLQKSLAKAAGLVTTFVAGFVTVRSAIDGVNQAMQRLDAQGKLADRLNISTKALAGIQQAAALAGVDVEQATKGLERMGVTIADASRGLLTAQRAFAALNLDVSRLSALAPEKQLIEISRALQGVQNQQERLQIARDIFGQRNVQFLNLLQGGPGQIEEGMREAERLGLALSREQIALIEQANDARAKTLQAVQGIFNSIAAAIAPYLRPLWDIATNQLVALREMGPSMVRGLVSFLNSALGSIRSMLSVLLDVSSSALLFLSDKLQALTEFFVRPPTTVRPTQPGDVIKGMAGEPGFEILGGTPRRGPLSDALDRLAAVLQSEARQMRQPFDLNILIGLIDRILRGRAVMTPRPGVPISVDDTKANRLLSEIQREMKQINASLLGSAAAQASIAQDLNLLSIVGASRPGATVF